MKVVFINIVVAFVFLYCSPSGKNQEQSIGDEHMKNDGKEGVFTVDDFLELNYQNIISSNSLLNKQDSLIENKFVDNKIDTLSFLTFGNSKITFLNSQITRLEIQDSELVSNFIIKFGATQSELRRKFKDFENRSKKTNDDGAFISVEKDNISIYSSIEQTEEWGFTFKNDSLLFIYYEAYFE